MEYWKCIKCNIPFTSSGAAMVHVNEAHPGKEFNEIIGRVV